ncbi:MAG: hypothetical protein K2O06_08715 [Acetatifactor sp.]|nr:hypothetical protein [Acetatifactor sp.]
MAAGASLDNCGEVDFADWRRWLAVLLIALTTAPILGWTIKSIETYGNRQKEFSDLREKHIEGRRYFFCVWGILFLAYMLPFLASFPGFFTYDAETEVYMVFTNKYSAHHPVLHVLLLGWAIRAVYYVTKSYNAGIACYTLLQMAALSACFAYMMNFLYTIGVKRWVRNIGICFLALFPTVSMFVCCSTKDSIFSGGVVLFTTILLDMARDMEAFWQRKGKKICFGLAIFLILSFRNNGIYALVLFFIVFAVVYKKIWKKWLIPVLMAFLVFGITTGVLGRAFHFIPGELAEMLCVPMQQLARTYAQAEDSFTEQERETLFTLLPELILEKYNPKLADNVKVNFLEDNFKSDPGKYISLWAALGLRHPDIYINSFLINTFGYWYPDTVPDGYRGKTISSLKYEDSSYFAFETERPGERVHLLPVLENFYKKCSLEIYQQKVPVVSMLFSMGFWHWCYAFLILYLVLTSHRKQAFAFVFMGLIYLTVLLGPIALVRYVLYFFFLVPLLLALLFDTETVAG